jgi:hypothetical protein
MTIEKNHYEKIIDDIKIGNSVAENDLLLVSTYVETPVLYDVLNDKYDIVPGRKGAGKTAIFKIIGSLSTYLLRRKNTVLLTGVDAAGEPVFNKFKKEFANFTEDDFENFWKLYLVSLINNGFIKNAQYEAALSGCGAEIKKFQSDCFAAGIPDFPAAQSKSQIISVILSRLIPKIKSAKTTVIHDLEKPSLFTAIPEIEFENSEQSDSAIQASRESVYVNQIGESLNKILEKSGLKVWVMLDRLDEVFERFSYGEFNGLRGLLKAYKSFDAGQENGLLRIKIFLRDDIKAFLTDAQVYRKFFPRKNIPPLAAATHILSKEAPTLFWSEEEIEQLILRRLLSSKLMRDYLGITGRYPDLDDDRIEEGIKEELRNRSIRAEYWGKIFPEKIQSSPSLKWIFTRLRDSNGVVTPRTVIDMLDAAVNFQKKKNQTNFEDSNEIFSTEALKEGMDIASKYKLEKDIYNEFPKEQQNIKKLEKEGKPKLNKIDLKRIYGDDWLDVAEELRRMGILRHIKNSDEYMIEFLFRPGLNILYKH